MLIILMYLTVLNTEIDEQNRKELENEPSHKEIPIEPPTLEEKLKMESVIEQYIKNRNKNKSNCAKMKEEVSSSLFRGIVAGVLLSGGLTDGNVNKIVSGAAAGGVVFGTLGGIISGYNLSSRSMKYVAPHKHT